MRFLDSVGKLQKHFVLFINKFIIFFVNFVINFGVYKALEVKFSKILL